jgi:hypothetical protein
MIGSEVCLVVRHASTPTQQGCKICGEDTKHNAIILCDACSSEFHIFCLKPADRKCARKALDDDTEVMM